MSAGLTADTRNGPHHGGAARTQHAHNAAVWAQVREGFDRLAELAPTERHAALQAADLTAELRAEVADLLAQHEAEERAGNGFLGAPASLAMALDEAGAQAEVLDRTGQRLGPWRIAAQLGAGGMGDVWEAHRSDGAYDARVAIKVLRPGRYRTAMLERFALEQRSLARLDHPHIARLLDAGRTDDGAPYFVMEAVAGRPIDVACTGLDLAARLGHFLQLADAVAHAHRHLLVHGDLKPANVLVSDDGQVKLLDFGIAQVLQAPDPEPLAADARSEASAMQPGAATGASAWRALTPSGASPEQVRGEPVGTPTDVYSLGVLLHRLLTGAAPYGPHVRTTADQMNAVLHDTPTAPSRTPPAAAGDPGVARHLLAGDLDAIVAQAMHKRIDARYPSVDALAADVRAHLAGLPVAARPATWAYHGSKFIQRHRAAVLGGAATLLVLVLGLGAAAWQARDAVSVLALLALALGLGATAWQAQRASAARDEARARLAATRLIAREIVVRYADTITYLPGGLQMKANLLKDTLAHLQRLLDSAGGDAALSGDMAMAHARLADIQQAAADASLREPEDCLRNTERALSLFPAGESAHRDDANYYLWWGRALRARATQAREQGDAQAMLRWAERQRDLLQLATARFPAASDLRDELASSLLVIGHAHDVGHATSLNNPAAALLAYTASEKIYLELAAERPAESSLQHQLGVIAGARMLVLCKQGRDSEGIEFGRQAVAYKRAALALEPGNVAYSGGLAGECNNLAVELLRLGQASEALQWTRLGDATMRALERSDPDTPVWSQRRRYFALHHGRALLANGLADEAVPPLREAIAEMAPATAGALVRRRGWARLELVRAWAALADAPAAAADGANAQAVLGELDLALQDLQAFVAAAPGDADGWALLQQAQALKRGMTPGPGTDHPAGA